MSDNQVDWVDQTRQATTCRHGGVEVDDTELRISCHIQKRSNNGWREKLPPGE